MENKEKDLFRLEHILECAIKIEMLTTQLGSFEDFSEKWIEQDAMTRNFEIIGEAAKNISEETIRKFPEIEWFKIKGMRNLIAHEYFGVRLEAIWDTAINDIPVLKEQIQKIIQTFH